MCGREGCGGGGGGCLCKKHIICVCVLHHKYCAGQSTPFGALRWALQPGWVTQAARSTQDLLFSGCDNQLQKKYTYIHTNTRNNPETRNIAPSHLPLMLAGNQPALCAQQTHGPYICERVANNKHLQLTNAKKKTDRLYAIYTPTSCLWPTSFCVKGSAFLTSLMRISLSRLPEANV